MMYFTESELYLNKRLASSVVLLISCFFLVTCFNTVYDWVAVTPSNVTFLAIRAPHITYHLEDISSWHLLGGNPNTTDLPETNLQLSLQGVLSMPDPAHGSAIIAQPGQPGKVYQPGDLLPGGAILDKVMVDKVLILNRGRLETLSLMRPGLQFAPVPPSIWS